MTFIYIDDDNDDIDNDEACTTVAGPIKGAKCILPFHFNGTTHDKCLWDAEGAWCSTKVDNNGNHTVGQGNWGYCHYNCPIPRRPAGIQQNEF